jgi:hypothetical protein
MKLNVKGISEPDLPAPPMADSAGRPMRITLTSCFITEKMREKVAARKYPTCLDIYGCRELGLSEAKGKFIFALKRDKEKSFSNLKGL